MNINTVININYNNIFYIFDNFNNNTWYSTLYTLDTSILTILVYDLSSTST